MYFKVKLRLFLYKDTIKIYIIKTFQKRSCFHVRKYGGLFTFWLPFCVNLRCNSDFGKLWTDEDGQSGMTKAHLIK